MKKIIAGQIAAAYFQPSAATCELMEPHSFLLSTLPSFVNHNSSGDFVTTSLRFLSNESDILNVSSKRDFNGQNYG